MDNGGTHTLDADAAPIVKLTGDVIVASDIVSHGDLSINSGGAFALKAGGRLTSTDGDVEINAGGVTIDDQINASGDIDIAAGGAVKAGTVDVQINGTAKLLSTGGGKKITITSVNDAVVDGAVGPGSTDLAGIKVESTDGTVKVAKTSGRIESGSGVELKGKDVRLEGVLKTTTATASTTDFEATITATEKASILGNVNVTGALQINGKEIEVGETQVDSQGKKSQVAGGITATNRLDLNASETGTISGASQLFTTADRSSLEIAAKNFSLIGALYAGAMLDNQGKVQWVGKAANIDIDVVELMTVGGTAVDANGADVLVGGIAQATGNLAIDVTGGTSKVSLNQNQPGPNANSIFRTNADAVSGATNTSSITINTDHDLQLAGIVEALDDDATVTLVSKDQVLVGSLVRADKALSITGGDDDSGISILISQQSLQLSTGKLEDGTTPLLADSKGRLVKEDGGKHYLVNFKGEFVDANGAVVTSANKAEGGAPVTGSGLKTDLLVDANGRLTDAQGNRVNPLGTVAFQGGTASGTKFDPNSMSADDTGRVVKQVGDSFFRVNAAGEFIDGSHMKVTPVEGDAPVTTGLREDLNVNDKGRLVDAGGYLVSPTGKFVNAAGAEVPEASKVKSGVVVVATLELLNAQADDKGRLVKEDGGKYYLINADGSYVDANGAVKKAADRVEGGALVTGDDVDGSLHVDEFGHLIDASGSRVDAKGQPVDASGMLLATGVAKVKGGTAVNLTLSLLRQRGLEADAKGRLIAVVGGKNLLVNAADQLIDANGSVLGADRGGAAVTGSGLATNLDIDNTGSLIDESGIRVDPRGEFVAAGAKDTKVQGGAPVRLSGGVLDTGADGTISITGEQRVLISGAVGELQTVGSSVTVMTGTVSVESTAGDVAVMSANGSVPRINAKTYIELEGKNVDIAGVVQQRDAKPSSGNYGVYVKSDDAIRTTKDSQVIGRELVHLFGQTIEVFGGVAGGAERLLFNAVEKATIGGSVIGNKDITVNAGVDAGWSQTQLTAAIAKADLTSNATTPRTAVVTQAGQLDAVGNILIQSSDDFDLTASAVVGGRVTVKTPVISTSPTTIQVVVGTRMVEDGTITVPVISYVDTVETISTPGPKVVVGSEFSTMDVTLTQVGYYNGTTIREYFVENVDYCNSSGGNCKTGAPVINWGSAGTPATHDTPFDQLNDDQRKAVLDQLSYKALYDFSASNLQNVKVENGASSNSPWTPAWQSNNTKEIIFINTAGWDDKYIRLPVGAAADVRDKLNRVSSFGTPSTNDETVGQLFNQADAQFVQDRSTYTATAQRKRQACQPYDVTSCIEVQEGQVDFDDEPARWDVRYVANTGKTVYNINTVDVTRMVDHTSVPGWDSSTKGVQNISVPTAGTLRSNVHNLFVDDRGSVTYKSTAQRSGVDVGGIQWYRDRFYNEYQRIDGSFSWDAAKTDAESKGGHLATIADTTELSKINHFREAWVGAKQDTGATEPAGGWKWVDGSSVSSSIWGPNEPNQYNGAPEDFAILNGNGHVVDTVDGGDNYILEIDLDTGADPKSNPDRGTRYALVKTKETWEDARDAAAAITSAGGITIPAGKAHLAVPGSVTESNYLGKLFGVNADPWIGLNDAATEGTWETVAGAPSTSFTNGNPNEPKNGGQNGDTIQFRVTELYITDDTEQGFSPDEEIYLSVSGGGCFFNCGGNDGFDENKWIDIHDVYHEISPGGSRTIYANEHDTTSGDDDCGSATIYHSDVPPTFNRKTNLKDCQLNLDIDLFPPEDHAVIVADGKWYDVTSDSRNSDYARWYIVEIEPFYEKTPNIQETQNDYTFDWKSKNKDIKDKRTTLTYKWTSTAQDIEKQTVKTQTVVVQKQVTSQKTETRWKDVPIYRQDTILSTTRVKQESIGNAAKFGADSIRSAGEIKVDVNGDADFSGNVEAHQAGGKIIVMGENVTVKGGVPTGSTNAVAADSDMRAKQAVEITATERITIGKSGVIKVDNGSGGAKSMVSLNAKDIVIDGIVDPPDEIQINATNNIELKGDVQALEKVNVEAGMNITGNVNTSVTTLQNTGSGNAIEIKSTGGNVVLKDSDVQAGSGGNVMLTATNGMVEQTGGVVSGGDLIVTAKNGFKTNANTGNVKVELTDAGNIDVTLNGTTVLDFAGKPLKDGFLKITNFGDLTVKNLEAQGTDDDDDIVLRAINGNLTVENLSTSGDGDITLLSTGSFTLTDGANHPLETDTLTIQAGGAVDVQTKVNTIAVTTTGTGNVAVTQNTGALTIDDSIIVAGTLTVNATADTLTVGDVQVLANNHNTVATLTSKNDLIINERLKAGPWLADEAAATKVRLANLNATLREMGYFQVEGGTPVTTGTRSDLIVDVNGHLRDATGFRVDPTGKFLTDSNGAQIQAGAAQIMTLGLSGLQVDAQGRLLKDVSGTNYLVNGGGQFVDTDGNVVADADKLPGGVAVSGNAELRVDVRGRLINQDGHRVDPQGVLVDASGAALGQNVAKVMGAAPLQLTLGLANFSADSQGRLVKPDSGKNLLVNAEGKLIDEAGFLVTSTNATLPLLTEAQVRALSAATLTPQIAAHLKTIRDLDGSGPLTDAEATDEADKILMLTHPFTSVGNVALTSQDGQIRMSNASPTAPGVIGDVLTLDAETGIDLPMIAINTLETATTTMGDISLGDDDSVGEELVGVHIKSANAPAGNVSLSSEETMRVGNVVAGATTSTVTLVSTKGGLELLKDPHNATTLTADDNMILKANLDILVDTGFTSKKVIDMRAGRAIFFGKGISPTWSAEDRIVFLSGSTTRFEGNLRAPEVTVGATAGNLIVSGTIEGTAGAPLKNLTLVAHGSRLSSGVASSLYQFRSQKDGQTYFKDIDNFKGQGADSVFELKSGALSKVANPSDLDLVPIVNQTGPDQPEVDKFVGRELYEHPNGRDYYRDQTTKEYFYWQDPTTKLFPYLAYNMVTGNFDTLYTTKAVTSGATKDVEVFKDTAKTMQVLDFNQYTSRIPKLTKVTDQTVISQLTAKLAPQVGGEISFLGANITVDDTLTMIADSNFTGGDANFTVNSANGTAKIDAGGDVVFGDTMKVNNEFIVTSSGYVGPTGNAGGGNIDFAGKVTGTAANSSVTKFKAVGENGVHLRPDVVSAGAWELGGQITINSAAADVPGDSVGTVPVPDVTFLDGSRLRINALKGMSGMVFDKLEVTGSVTIEQPSGGPGVALQVVRGTGVTLDSEFIIIENDGGDAVTGNFSKMSLGTEVKTTAGDGNDVGVTLRMITAQFDWGDAPTRYPVTSTDDGARHKVDGPRLRTQVDIEMDGVPSDNADGDNNDTGSGPDAGNGNDQDGVTFRTNLIGGLTGVMTTTATVNLQNANGAKLDGWIDFNNDGDWDDAGEKIFNNVNLVSGDNVIPFDIPAGSTPGATFARIRVSTDGKLTPTGEAQDGEVEDYKLTLIDKTTNPNIVVPAINATGQIDVMLDGDSLVLQQSGKTLLKVPNAEVNTVTVNDAVTINQIGQAVDEHITYNVADSSLSVVPLAGGTGVKVAAPNAAGFMFSGGGGNDKFTVDDSAATTNKTVTVSDSKVTGVTSQDVNFSGMETLELLTGSGADDVTVTTSSTMAVMANLGDGNDSVTLDFTSSGPNTNVTLDGSTGTNSLALRNLNAMSVDYDIQAADKGQLTFDGASAPALVFDKFGTVDTSQINVETWRIDLLTQVPNLILEDGPAAGQVTLRGAQAGGMPNTTIGSTARTVTLNSGDDAQQLSVTTNRYNAASGRTMNVNLQQGNDTLVLADGVGINGTINGGPGTDTLDYSAYTTAVTVDLPSSSATNLGTLANGTTGNSFENVTTGSGNDSVIADADTNVIMTGDGDDNVIGGRGGDTIQTGSGADTISVTSSEGNSAVNVDAGADDDQIFVGNNMQHLGAFTQDVNIVGGGGTDSIVVTDSMDSTDNTAKITDRLIQGLSQGDINLTDVENGRVLGGTGNDNYLLTNIVNMTYTLLTNDGDDIITLNKSEGSVEGVTVEGGDGDDMMDIVLSGTGLVATQRPVTFNAGAGFDQLRIYGDAGGAQSHYQVRERPGDGTIEHWTASERQTVHFTGLEEVANSDGTALNASVGGLLPLLAAELAERFRRRRRRRHEDATDAVFGDFEDDDN